jgi:hypothetical protein
MAKVPIVPQTGLIFRETFRNVGDVIENGGSINGGVVNNGYLSDASGQNIKYPTQFNGQSLTIAAKIDLTFISGTFQTLFAIRNISGTYFEVGIDGTASTSDKKMYFFDGTIRYSTTTIPSTTKHITYTKDSSHNIIFYADGVKVGSTVVGVALTNPLPNFYIGATYSGTQSMRGTAEEFYFYDRALSAEEVLDLYEEDTFQEVDDSKFLLSLPLRSNYNDGSNQVTENIGSLGGTVQLGDGTTSTTFPTQLTPKGMSFDGGDYIETGASVSTEGALAVLFRPSSVAGNIIIMGAQTTSPNERCYLSFLSGGVISGGIGSQSFGTIKGSASDLVYAGSVAHAVITWDGTTVDLYLNGENVYSGAQSGGVPTSHSIAVGANHSNTVYNANITGDIYTARIATQKLTLTQTKGLYEKDRRFLNI